VHYDQKMGFPDELSLWNGQYCTFQRAEKVTMIFITMLFVKGRSRDG